jgi:hypothetical protein
MRSVYGLSMVLPLDSIYVFFCEPYMVKYSTISYGFFCRQSVVELTFLPYISMHLCTRHSLARNPFAKKSVAFFCVSSYCQIKLWSPLDKEVFDCWQRLFPSYANTCSFPSAKSGQIGIAIKDLDNMLAWTTSKSVRASRLWFTTFA